MNTSFVTSENKFCSIISSHAEISWDEIIHYKTYINKYPKPSDICCNYFYGMLSDNVMNEFSSLLQPVYKGVDTMPMTCLNIYCERVHTTDLEKIRYLLGSFVKTKHCKDDVYCEHYFCYYIHSIDDYIFTRNGKYICPHYTPTQRHNAVIHWRDWRHRVRY